MHDIRLAIGLISFLAIGAYLLAFRLLKGLDRKVLDATAVSTLLLMGAYMYYIWGQLWIVKWIPLPSVIVLANWFPIFLGVLAACLWLRFPPRFTGRRVPVMSLILIGAVASMLWFVPLRAIECEEEEWIAYPPLPPVCLQTTRKTCSAAAAATLLRTVGVKTNEQEMAKLCLTQSGTTWLGLYHGLSTKLHGKNHKVEFFECDPQDLPALAKDGPLILCCQLTAAEAEAVPAYVTEGGWIPGTAHSVVYIYGKEDWHFVGDPSRGYETWPTADLKTLWSGQGLRLVRKPNAPVPDSAAN